MMAGFAKFVLALASGIGQTLMGGFVFSKLWAWFIVGKFTGAPSLDYLEAIGVSLVFHFLLLGVQFNLTELSRKVTREEGEYDNIIRTLVFCLVMYPAMLLIGYLWHQVLS